MFSPIFKVGIAVAAGVLVSCASGSNEALIENLDRCAAFMRQIDSDSWPSADVIEEGADTFRRMQSEGAQGSVYLSFDPALALRNCAEMLGEYGRNEDARDMRSVARWYETRNREAFR